MQQYCIYVFRHLGGNKMNTLKLVMLGMIIILVIPAFAETNSIGVPPASKGKAFNPDVSANFLGLLQEGLHDSSGILAEDRTKASRNGLSLQEAEVQFTSDVD